MSEHTIVPSHRPRTARVAVGLSIARQRKIIADDPRSTFDRSKGGYASDMVIHATLVP